MHGDILSVMFFFGKEKHNWYEIQRGILFSMFWRKHLIIEP